MTTVAIVVPARGAGSRLDTLAESLSRQSRSADEVVVVDDGPTATDAARARRLGFRVLATGGVGAYAARNAGWRITSTDIVLFADMRSVPMPSWVESVVAALDDPAVAVTGTGSSVVAGPSIASQLAVEMDFFSTRTYCEDPFFLPYLPTANFGTRRSVLEALDGFAEVGSGGDADFCWRAQLLGLGSVLCIPDVHMRWFPRERVRDHLAQQFKYGTSHYALVSAYRAHGASLRPPQSSRWFVTRILAGLVFSAAGRSGSQGLARKGLRLLHEAAFEWGYKRAPRRLDPEEAARLARGL